MIDCIVNILIIKIIINKIDFLKRLEAKMKFNKQPSKLTLAIGIALALSACSEHPKNTATIKQNTVAAIAQQTKDENKLSDFNWVAERFADIRVLRYQVPGFNELPLETKELLYYLYEAALSGRDMTWDQNYKYNLTIRHTLEAIQADYQGDRTTEEFNKLVEYTKRVVFKRYSSSLHVGKNTT
jgi:dipeptidyl-peptidase-3